MENDGIQSRIIDRNDIVDDSVRVIVFFNCDIRVMDDFIRNTDGINDVNINRASTIQDQMLNYVSFSAGVPLSSTNTVKAQSEKDMAKKSLSANTISPVVLFTAKCEEHAESSKSKKKRMCTKNRIMQRLIIIDIISNNKS